MQDNIATEILTFKPTYIIFSIITRESLNLESLYRLIKLIDILGQSLTGEQSVPPHSVMFDP